MYERFKEQRKEEIQQKRKAELAEIRERSAIVNQYYRARLPQVDQHSQSDEHSVHR